MGIQFIKRLIKMKEQRNKTKTVRIRVSDEMYYAFSKYTEEKSITKTKVITDFLEKLLVDELREVSAR